MSYKVCHITSVHKPFDSRIFEKECVSMAKLGHEVTLVHAFEETGLYSGVNVVGVNAQYSGRVKRMLNTSKAVVQKALTIKADIYHFHDPELLLHAKKMLKTGAKVIYDSHEDLPCQILDKPYIPTIFRKPISALIAILEKGIASRLSGVVTATDFISDKFLRRQKNVQTIHNYPILDDYNFDQNWVGKENQICYVGGIFAKRGAVEMIEAMHGVSAIFALAGNYSPPALRRQMQELPAWEKVLEHGYVNRQEVLEIYKKSKIGLVVLHPTKSYVEALPIKMFEYMAAGIPVIASNFPLWQNIVEKHACGICVNPLNPQAIKNAIEHLLNNPNEAQEMGQKGKKAAFDQYVWEKEANNLNAFYQTLLQ